MTKFNETFVLDFSLLKQQTKTVGFDPMTHLRDTKCNSIGIHHVDQPFFCSVNMFETVSEKLINAMTRVIETGHRVLPG